MKNDSFVKRFLSYASGQTDKQTDILITILCNVFTPWGQWARIKHDRRYVQKKFVGWRYQLDVGQLQ